MSHLGLLEGKKIVETAAELLRNPSRLLLDESSATPPSGLEALALVRATSDLYSPQLAATGEAILQDLLESHFPGCFLQLPSVSCHDKRESGMAGKGCRVETPGLLEALRAELRERHLQYLSAQVDKV